ncbi:MAG TPA: hypothetical protein VFB58_06255 [Chloroflexota bacterium]|nr:hypothetical protein [Chloroflexota bacterium]
MVIPFCLLAALLAVASYLLGIWDIITPYLRRPGPESPSGPTLPPAASAHSWRDVRAGKSYVDYSGSISRRTIRRDPGSGHGR